MNERKYSDYLREECNFVTNVKLKTSNVEKDARTED
jgi:hypothetical protein